MTTHPDVPLHMLVTAYPGRVRDASHRILNVSKAARAELDIAWSAYANARTACALVVTRANHDALKAAARVIVAFQTGKGYWLIHPFNAEPGLRSDDARLI